MAEPSAWRIGGTYLETCNCDAICPCRTIGGRKGGRSTTGLCLGALSWQISDGGTDDVDLSGLRAVLANKYDDDEPGSPWYHHLYVDDRGDECQRQALEAIFLGRLGGTPAEQFPWVFKASELLGVDAVPIEIEHAPTRGWFRAGKMVSVRVGEQLADQEPVTCIIPGHDRSGHELYSEAVAVDDGPLEYSYDGKCAYWSTFDYSGDGRLK
jgi:hypothetical protein